RGARPVKALVSRFAYAMLIAAAVGLMLLGKIEAVLVERARTHLTDAAAPLLDLLSRPVAYIAAIGETIGELATLREENARLRAENERLMRWWTIAQRLQGENRELRELLRLDPGPAATFVSARTIADTGGAFARTILVNVGARDGV